mmetsp:Transcript_22318/g.31235  ORF Transcript_22318/g.31235 Transcript_22318/m.31235 type:complete len:208 (-) Transcript_22318:374-997(-)|eukprot:CAMPEP_0185267748 /NCGR_PEP_ID=MMETSP1359-20130426/35147_1 /TAXON_ID=552665 /ORGANISM="Bigelowiella longifila, Strain CCMP242" /LENGTH=207 /DNA_ID=CAMNT_0027858211 /DNA_START=26 /DNA_END=649 /DNA_ORIENTATION=+
MECKAPIKAPPPSLKEVLKDPVITEEVKAEDIPYVDVAKPNTVTMKNLAAEDIEVTDGGWGLGYAARCGSRGSNEAWRFLLASADTPHKDSPCIWVRRMGGSHKRPARDGPTKGWVEFTISKGLWSAMPELDSKTALSVTLVNRGSSPQHTDPGKSKRQYYYTSAKVVPLGVRISLRKNFFVVERMEQSSSPAVDMVSDLTKSKLSK